jgi:alcohol dehydrogenase
VAACTRSRDKGEKLRALGADHVIVTSEQDYVEETRRLWGRPRVFISGGGADVVVNYDGGESWAECFKALKFQGRLLICGATNGYGPKTDLRYIWSFEFNIIGSNGWKRADLEVLLQLVKDGQIKPVQHSVRPLAELPQSLQELIDRKVVGKAILIP